MVYQRRTKPPHFTTEQRQFVLDNFVELKEAMPSKNGWIVYNLIKRYDTLSIVELMKRTNMSKRTLWSHIWFLLDHGWIVSTVVSRFVSTESRSLTCKVHVYKVNK